MRIGLSLDTFWQSSTQELRAYIEAWSEADRLDWRRDITLAWHTALFARTAMFSEDGLKPLAEYLGDPPPQKTVEQQKAEFQAFAATWGLTVRPASKKIKVVYPKGHPKHEAA